MPAIAPPTPREPRPRRPLNPHLVEVLRRFRGTFGSVFVFSFAVNLLTLAVPLYLLQIYAKVLPSGNLDTLAFLTGMALAAIVTLGALEAIRRAVLAKAGARFEHELGEHLLDSAIHRAIAKEYPSVNALRELAGLRNFIGGSSMLPLLDLPWSPLFVLVLFVLHPWLGWIGTAGALLLLLIAILNEHLTREPQREASRSSRDLLDDARAWVGNADVIEAMGLQGELRSRWKSRGAEATLAQHRAGRLNTRLSSLSKLTRLFLQIAMIAAAALLITRGELTAGATLASVLLLRRAISPLEQSIRSWKAVLSAREGARTISEYLDHAATLVEPSSLPAPTGSLVARRLSYRRSGEDRSILSRIDLELPPGTLTALTGATGSGKSTLLRVLAGIVAPSGGKVMIGGHDLALWRAEQRGPHIGYLPQDVSLFPATVRENIARLGDASIEDVIDAAERANAHELVQSLPSSYDTPIDADARNLSGGQRQRIGYARALFGAPGVVLLDEPDANLDAEGRSALRKSLRRLRRSGVAILAITHHASLERLADRVYRLQNGKLQLERSDDEAFAARHATDPMIAEDAVTSAVASSLQASVPRLELLPAPSADPIVQDTLGLADRSAVGAVGGTRVVPLMRPAPYRAPVSPSASPTIVPDRPVPATASMRETIVADVPLERDTRLGGRSIESPGEATGHAVDRMSADDGMAPLRRRMARKRALYARHERRDRS